MVPSTWSCCGRWWSCCCPVDRRSKCATRRVRRPGPESRAPAVIPIPRVTIVSSGPRTMVSWHHHLVVVVMVYPVAVVDDGGEHDIHGTGVAWSDGSSPWRCRRIDQWSSSSSSCRAWIHPPDHHDCSSSSSFVETRRTKSYWDNESVRMPLDTIPPLPFGHHVGIGIDTTPANMLTMWMNPTVSSDTSVGNPTWESSGWLGDGRTRIVVVDILSTVRLAPTTRSSQHCRVVVAVVLPVLPCHKRRAIRRSVMSRTGPLLPPYPYYYYYYHGGHLPLSPPPPICDTTRWRPFASRPWR